MSAQQKRETYRDMYMALRDDYRNLKRRYSKLAARRRVEFSKVILSMVMATYFIGLFFGIYAVSKILLGYPEWAIQALISLFGYVGAPVGIAIGFYSWKAKNENALKIRHTNGRGTNNDG